MATSGTRRSTHMSMYCHRIWQLSRRRRCVHKEIFTQSNWNAYRIVSIRRSHCWHCGSVIQFVIVNNKFIFFLDNATE